MKTYVQNYSYFLHSTEMGVGWVFFHTTKTNQLTYGPTEPNPIHNTDTTTQSNPTSKYVHVKYRYLDYFVT